MKDTTHFTPVHFWLNLGIAFVGFTLSTSRVGAQHAGMDHGGMSQKPEDMQHMEGMKDMKTDHSAMSQKPEGVQHMEDMQGMNMDMDGVPHTRQASGTSWQPDSTPIHAQHFMLDDWNAMLHYNVFLDYDKQWGPRGDDQINSVNWFMFMASHELGGGEFTFRTMLSLEPATTTDEGYPLLFQSGEAFHGRALVDRQHPHDLFMEVAALYRHPLGDKTSLAVYLAPSGEPALGPTAFPHRVSAMDLPAAPIGHHWLDSTHIAFGVATVALSYDKWQIEGSVFNGREPDEDRWDFDKIQLDSWAARISYNPGPDWSLQASHGFLDSPEELHPQESLRRTTASIMHNHRIGGDGNWATTAAWGMNDSEGRRTNAVLLESKLNLGGRKNFFGRAEYVQKAGEDLDVPSDRDFGITQLTVGASYELTPGKSVSTALGASVSYSFMPDGLKDIYGDHPWGMWVFLRLRPGEMHMPHESRK